MVIAKSNNTLSTKINLKHAYQQSLLDNQTKLSTVRSLWCNLGKQSLEERKQDEIVNTDWLDDIKNSENYKEYQSVFLKILELFQNI